MERAELARLCGAAPSSGNRERVVISTADPADFRVQFGRAAAGSGEVFLFNPQWGAAERVAAEQVLASPPAPLELGRGWLMIPTGGSSGAVKFARHDHVTIGAAVRGFIQHFGLARVNALGLLPLHHVSGLMAWMRCLLTGGTYVDGDWKAIEAGVRPELDAATDGWVTSLVPTQLERLLRDPGATDWLRRFRIIFLGGAPAAPELLDRAAAARLPLSLSYGMTETAAMVAALRPEEFLSGDRSSGRPLPHARVTLDAEGAIQIGGPSLLRGYYPEWRHERKLFVTADAGAWDSRGGLVVLGRRDAAIISGGEKIHPHEVEAALRDAVTGEFAIIGLPDAEWGERVVAVFPPDAAPDGAAIARLAASRLSPPQRPKDYLVLAEWPRNAVGKLNRARLRELAGAALRTGGSAAAG